MPLIKDIAFRSETAPAGAQPLTLTIDTYATGAAGYYTASNSGSSKYIAGGATLNTPIYMVFTASMNGGTAPYSMSWTSSYAEGGQGYTYLDNRETQSFQYTVYTGEDTLWTVYASDSSTPTQYASASIYSVTAGRDNVGVPEMWVATNGSDTPTDLHLIQTQGMYYGGFTGPFKTIQGAINYSVPEESRIKLKSGTYAESPVINKKIHSINGAGDNASSSLSASHYFIYGVDQYDLANNKIFGFFTSSYWRIGVNTNGIIQSAVRDASFLFSSASTFPEIYLLAGTHNINNTISTSLNDARFTISGVYVPTGSADTYKYDPPSRIRLLESASIFTLVGSNQIYFKHLALEIDQTGSFFTIQNGSSRDGFLEMVRFRIVSGGQGWDMMHYNFPNTTAAYSGKPMSNFTNEIGYRIANVMYHQIFDGRESVQGYGSGKIYFLDYVFGATQTQEQFRGAFNASACDGAAVNITVSGSTFGNIYQNGTSVNFGGATFPSDRPVWGFNDHHFDGMPYVFVPGNGTRGYMEANISVPYSYPVDNASAFAVYHTTGSQSWLSGSRRVVAKWGNASNGWSLAISNSRAIMSFYIVENGATQSAILQGPIEANRAYLSEMFFDNTSTNKRVGMALYNSSSLVTSSYFTLQQFSASAIPTITAGAASVQSLGMGSGHYRINDFVRLGTGRLDPFGGRYAEVAFFTDSGSASNRRCKAHYDYLRFKYFKNSPVVTRSIFSDTDNY